METARVQFVIGEREAEEISAYFQIAKINRSMLTLGEVLEVTSIRATEEDMEAAWKANTVLSSRYALNAGWIVEKNADPRLRSESVDTERQNRQRSADNIRAAGRFATLCVGDNVKLIAVSGGNSYRSARAQEDIDFFSVTANDSVWIFMLKALILARLRGFGTKTRAPFCFSYIVEERKARKDFGSPGDGLFARDALMAHVLSGARYYQSLLSESKWMKRYFPNLYRRRVTFPAADQSSGESRDGHAVLNSFLFYTLGTYVRAKAFLLNRRLQKARNSSAFFQAEIGKDRCIYESNRYKRLRRMYPPARSEGGAMTYQESRAEKIAT